MKKTLSVILVCCILFGCGKTGAEAPKLEVKADGQDNKVKLEGIGGLKIVLGVVGTISAGFIVIWIVSCACAKKPPAVPVSREESHVIGSVKNEKEKGTGTNPKIKIDGVE
jgi:hypothetical protein